MPKFEVDIEQVRQLVKLVEKYGLAELSVEEGGLSMTIKGVGPASAPVHIISGGATPQQIEIPAVTEPVEEVTPEPEEIEEEDLIGITAPLVGVFYRASSPDSPPFVEVGDVIEVGHEIGLIEAMKVFSPIPSEVAGTVVAIPADNGKLVQQGDTLVVIRPDKE